MDSIADAIVDAAAQIACREEFERSDDDSGMAISLSWPIFRMRHQRKRTSWRVGLSSW